MSEIKIAGIMRAGAYSCNHIGSDASIFNMVADQLRKRGCTVNVYSEEQFIKSGVKEDIIVNMCRDWRSYEMLQRLENEGKLVINSGYAIENCTRERVMLLLNSNGIPYPPSMLVNTNENVRKQLEAQGFEKSWVKQGHHHSKHREDVTFVRHAEEAQEILQEYFLRGITRAVINKHIIGEVVKFYGVLGTDFFHWFVPAPSGIFEVNREEMDARIREICNKAAETLDVVVYGGDCIITKEGDIYIIDFNDWPSYAPCRAQASSVIAKRIMQIIKSKTK